jgi:sulfoxide reductase catalytic subunit YedY
MMKKIIEAQITPENEYLNRRQFIQQSARLGLGLASFKAFEGLAEGNYGGGFSDQIKKTHYGEKLTPHTFKEISQYNNFYEFGTGKRDPAKNAHHLITKPWHISVSGECLKSGAYDLEDFIAPHQLEERVYRFRCVEAWSMVIPWVGVSLASVLRAFQPTSNAKYVVFKTLLDEAQMPGQKRPALNWPYIEGLSLAEAMHPLSFLAVGLYGKTLPNQNGAPIRLVVPWKYGFKNIKSIVSIHFQAQKPINSWQDQAADEYGFYANVNPNVDHPRWSQKRERVIGRGGFFSPEKRQTEIFNGYGSEVADLYTGLDLVKNF